MELGTDAEPRRTITPAEVSKLAAPAMPVTVELREPPHQPDAPERFAQLPPAIKAAIREGRRTTYFA